MRRVPVSLLLAFAFGVMVPAQEPPPASPAGPRSDHEQLEEEPVRSRAQNGQPHASGARPVRGPVVLGNPTASVVALRVGLHTTTFNTGVDIGSHPIDIARDPGSSRPALRQEFVAPNGLGTLEIRPRGLKGLRVHINELHDLSFDDASLPAETVRVDIPAFLVAGLNQVQFNPVGRLGQATVTVVVG